MGVKKAYTLAEAQSAIDIADERYFKQIRSVRSDVTNEQFNSSMFGNDVGHVFRHVEETRADGKSTYCDKATAVAVTRYLLNSAEGQAKLGELDAASPGGSFVESNPAQRYIEANIAGESFYGYTANGTHSRKIKRAICYVMKLGASTLWVHTSYPCQFQ